MVVFLVFCKILVGFFEFSVFIGLVCDLVFLREGGILVNVGLDIDTFS